MLEQQNAAETAQVCSSSQFTESSRCLFLCMTRRTLYSAAWPDSAKPMVSQDCAKVPQILQDACRPTETPTYLLCRFMGVLLHQQLPGSWQQHPRA